MKILTQKQESRNELKCCICGRFIAYDDFANKGVGWHDPTSVSDLEPQSKLPYHKACDKETK
jgi:hypothetical protein